MKFILNYLVLSIFLLLWVIPLSSRDRYTIIIDPGHGGINQKPASEFGDKYDTLSKKFLEPYKIGARYKGRNEAEIVLSLAKELRDVLNLMKTRKGQKEFSNIIKKYSNSSLYPIQFEILLTREDGINDDINIDPQQDINSKYRLFDFPDKKTGKMQKGRLSFINENHPYLVVSLHLNPSHKNHPGGMASVIAPPYRVFQDLRLISHGKLDPSSFTNSPYNGWVRSIPSWNHLENAICDAWIYFHGYCTNKAGIKPDLSKFYGYRYNMIHWAYRDPNGWEELAKKGGRGPYSKTHEEFLARGKFWNRERSQPEKWRRDQGWEGFGGDNLYAGNELLRFVQYGLASQLRDKEGKPPQLGPIHYPYISTYSLPTFTNAIVAYLEIGFIDNDRDMYYLENHTRIIAESLAVGIYSLFRGIQPKVQEDLPYIPKGIPIDFQKYERYQGKNYFYESSKI